jgi:hypothetical protein
MRKRAARFGIPYDPNAPVKTTAPKSKTNSAAPTTTAPAAAAAAAAAPASAATPASNKRENIAPDGVKSLGISDEVLAKRAAKFGPVDVQPAPKAAAVPEEKKEAVAATEKAVEPEKVAEVDPYVATFLSVILQLTRILARSLNACRRRRRRRGSGRKSSGRRRNQYVVVWFLK